MGGVWSDQPSPVIVGGPGWTPGQQRPAGRRVRQDKRAVAAPRRRRSSDSCWRERVGGAVTCSRPVLGSRPVTPGPDNSSKPTGLPRQHQTYRRQLLDSLLFLTPGRLPGEKAPNTSLTVLETLSSLLHQQQLFDYFNHQAFEPSLITLP